VPNFQRIEYDVNNVIGKLDTMDVPLKYDIKRGLGEAVI
jgi:hypothetical protein